MRKEGHSMRKEMGIAYAVANIPPLLSVAVKSTPFEVLGADDRDVCALEVEPWRSVGLK
jgi:hypothetical protein